MATARARKSRGTEIGRSRDRSACKRYRAKNRDRIVAEDRVRRRYLRRIVQALKSMPCEDCGGTFDPVCMDFDHRPDEIKSYEVSQMPSRYASIDAILDEIEKCDVVCSNCHRLRTKSRLLAKG